LQTHHKVFLVMFAAGLLSVVLGGITIVRHAQGVEAVNAVQLEITEVRVRPDDPSKPLAMQLRASSEDGFSYRIDSIRLVARVNDAIAGTLSRLELSVEVADGEPLTFDVELEPGSSYVDREDLEELRRAGRRDWYVDGFMEIYPPHSRSAERWDFAIEEVGAVE